MRRGDDFRKRTKSFALRVMGLVEALPRGKTADIIGRQLVRSGTSVADKEILAIIVSSIRTVRGAATA